MQKAERREQSAKRQYIRTLIITNYQRLITSIPLSSLIEHPVSNSQFLILNSTFLIFVIPFPETARPGHNYLCLNI